MPWEEVEYLLLRLGFTFTKVDDNTSRFSYRGDSRYSITLFMMQAATQWKDADVRQVMDYAYQMIVRYEKEQVQYGRSPLETLKPPLEVEEW